MSVVAHALLAVIRAYQRYLSSLSGRRCRFEPTCSEFAAIAIATHGAWRGTGLAIRRIGRCHPWSAGGFDPVPEQRPAG